MVKTTQSKRQLKQEINNLQNRLQIAEETLRAIQQGEVDALVIFGEKGEQIFTLQGADSSYRLLVEEMKEGAATLTPDGMLLYSNKRLASLLQQPLEKLIGSRFQQFISSPDLPIFEALWQQTQLGTIQAELNLIAADATQVPVYASINSFLMQGVQVNCLVVTDLSGQKRDEKIVAEEKLARSILDQGSESVLICDETGKIIRASQATRELCGKNPLFKEFDSLFNLKVISPSSLTLPIESFLSSRSEQKESKVPENFLISSVIEGKIFQSTEVLFERKDGKIFNLLLSARTLLSARDQFKYCLVTLTDITQRKQVEKALHLSEEKFRLATEFADIGCWDWNLATNELSWNDTHYRLFGLIPGSVKPNYGIWRDRIHPEDIERLEAEVQRAIQTRSFYNAEYRVVWEDGSLHWMNSRGQILDSEAGKPTRMLGTVFEISDRKQAEAALQSAKEELEVKVTQRTADLQLAKDTLEVELLERQRIQNILQDQAQLLDLAHDAIITLNMKRQITFWNQGAEEMYGISKLTVLGKKADALLQTQFPQPLLEIERELFQKERWEGELIQTKSDGEKIIVASRWTLKRDANGHPIEILEINNNITERKLTEQALQESEARYRRIVEMANEGIWELDANNNTTFANPKIAAMLGYSLQEMIGKSLLAFMDDKERPIAENYLQRRRQDIQEQHDFKFQCKNGSTLWTIVNATPILDETGQYAGGLAMVTDISDRKKTEELIHASLREKEVLLREIHHRVKNNMQIIYSLLRMQSRRTPDEQTATLLRDSQDRIKSMALVHEKLYRSQDLSAIDFSEYAKSLVSSLFTSYGITFNKIKVENKIQQMFLDIDTAIPCGLILNELISNCLKYAFPENRQGGIIIDLYRDNDKNIFIFKDNGIGMPKDFDPENTTTLGLKLVLSLVKQLDGTVEISRHEGTEFTITFGGGKVSCI